jgi:hypothetical protein
VSNRNCHRDGFYLERHRWWGWVVVETRRIEQGTSAILTWNCSGTGSQNYRSNYDIAFHYHRGPSARLSC